ncbi:MAG TPA: cytochrome P460 family protein [Pyrinomonadaceae bacterium]|nr:cytochrome P460 family protein [Pyrinomonadaceae bacterium]
MNQPPPPKDTRPAEPKHGDGSFGVVWVNAAGESAMASPKPQFPEGSIIVREKFLKKDDANPDLLAVMIKRQKGFKSASGDWEYLLLEGDLSKVRSRSATGVCNDCHLQQKAMDFVFGVTATK